MHINHTEKSISINDLGKIAYEIERLEESAFRGDPDATLRIKLAARKWGLEDPPKTTLNTEFAADVVACEHGWPGWEIRQAAGELDGLSRTELIRAAAVAAYVGNTETFTYCADQLFLGTEETLAIDLILGESRALDRLDRNNVNALVAPLNVQPLVYLCCVPLIDDKKANGVHRLTLVKALLELGADPNVGMYESETIRGYRTVLGGAIGFMQRPELVKLLLVHGADPADGPSLYEGSSMWEAIRQRDGESLQLLIEHDAPLWHLCHALTHALSEGADELVMQLLEANADPNWDKTVRGFMGNALHEAVVAAAEPAIVQALLDAGAKIDAGDRAGRTPLMLATALHDEKLIGLFTRQGADESRVRPYDRWVGSCFRTSASNTDLSAAPSEPPEPEAVEDELWLHEAVRRGLVSTTERLLHGRLNPNQPDYSGETALHVAVRGNNSALIGLLLDHGAEPTATDYQGANVVDIAAEVSRYGNANEVSAVLLDRLTEEQLTASAFRLSPMQKDEFEDAASCISSGDFVKLKQILDDNPSFINARSPRPHHCTLLNYVGVNGFEGERQKTPSNIVEIVKLLLERGADPNALCFAYRGGPGNNTVGLASSSGVPSEAGLMLPLLHALAKGGAEVDPVWALTIDLYDAHLENRLEAFFVDLDPRSRQVEETMIELAGQSATELVERFLQRGVDVNASRQGGVTALHQAAMSNNTTLVERLLHAGADPTLREDTWNGTPAGWADAFNHADLYRYLVEKQRQYESQQG